MVAFFNPVIYYPTSSTAGSWGSRITLGTKVTTSIVVGTTVPVGALVCVAVQALAAGNTVAGVSDSRSNSYLTAKATNVNNAGNGQLALVYSQVSSSLLSNDLITPTITGVGGQYYISAFFATGVTAGSPLDVANATNSGATQVGDILCTTGALSVAGDLIVGAVCAVTTGASGFTNQGSFTTPFDTESVHQTLGGGNEVSVGVSSVNFDPLNNGGSSQMAAVVAAFKVGP